MRSAPCVADAPPSPPRRRTETEAGRSSTPRRTPSSGSTRTPRLSPTASTPTPSPSPSPRLARPSGPAGSKACSARTADPRRRRSSPRSRRSRPSRPSKTIGERVRPRGTRVNQEPVARARPPAPPSLAQNVTPPPASPKSTRAGRVFFPLPFPLRGGSRKKTHRPTNHRERGDGGLRSTPPRRPHRYCRCTIIHLSLADARGERSSRSARREDGERRATILIR